MQLVRAQVRALLGRGRQVVHMARPGGCQRVVPTPSRVRCAGLHRYYSTPAGPPSKTNKELESMLGSHFYDERILPLSRIPPNTMSVRTMLEFWMANRELGDKLVESGNYLMKELPIRLCHRIVDIHNLPFVLACNPHLQKVYHIYLTSLETILAQPPLVTFDDNVRFSNMLKELFESHVDVVPALARALRDSKQHSPEHHQVLLQEFLNKMLVKRISTRMIVGQHLASMSMHPLAEGETNCLSEQEVIGLIERRCRPAEVVMRCAEAAQRTCEECYGHFPEVVIEGHTKIDFAYVRVHLEYILFEIIKNALRATVERHQRLIEEGEFNEGDDPPPVLVVVSGSEDEISIKVSDKGGGVASKALADIWTYGYSTASPVSTGSTPDREGNVGNPSPSESNARPPMHGFGFGLPLARIYAQYFGGDLQINSLVGYGSDVYLKINRLGRHMEKIEI